MGFRIQGQHGLYLGGLLQGLLRQVLFLLLLPASSLVGIDFLDFDPSFGSSCTLVCVTCWGGHDLRSPGVPSISGLRGFCPLGFQGSVSSSVSTSSEGLFEKLPSFAQQVFLVFRCLCNARVYRKPSKILNDT